MTPRLVFRTAAIAEAVTWAALLAGMVAKYVLRIGDAGVAVGGALHGVLDHRLEVETRRRLEHRQCLDDVVGDLAGQGAGAVTKNRGKRKLWSVTKLLSC